MAFDVQHHFRLTFRGSEEVVRLKTLDAGESENRICLCKCDDVIWDWINAELARIVVLHDVRVAKFGDVRGSVYTIGKVRPIFQAQSVAIGRNILPRHISLIYIRVLIINIKSLESRLTALVLSIINNGIKADRRPATAKVIKSETRLDIVRDGEHDLRKERRAPGARVRGRNAKTERVTERLIQVGPPENRDVPYVRGHVLENDAIVLIISDLLRVKVEIRSCRITRCKIASLHEITVIGD